MRGRALVVMVLLSLAAPLRAQVDELERGLLVRVSTRGVKLEGSFVRLAEDSLVVWRARQGSPGARPVDQAIALTEIERLEVGAPRSSARGAGRGALWGAAVGSLVGVLAGATMDTDCFLCPNSRGQALTVGVLGLGGVGTAVGALVGLAFPGTRWEDATPESLEAQASRGGP